jgi:hypothetical protein
MSINFVIFYPPKILECFSKPFTRRLLAQEQPAIAAQSSRGLAGLGTMLARPAH